MTTREKVIQLIDGMSDKELEAEYERLLQASAKQAVDDEFEAALQGARERSERLNLSIDVAQLIREERDWHAGRS
jgi:hypothetical protein